MINLSRSYLHIIQFISLIIIFDSCKEKPHPIILTTANVSGVTQTGAVSGGYIKADKNNLVTERGVCWDISSDPTTADNKTSDGNGTGSYLSILTGLQPGTYYFVRSYAITKRDTTYGNTISFSTQDFETVSDIEGNEYRTITIGTQTWMAMNLKTKKFNDGSAIPLVTDEAAWAGLSAPGYCWYKNDEATFKETYGALYNWYSTSTGKLCPAGWHVPSDEEWTVLTDYLGGEGKAGGKLKEKGTAYWVDPNAGATNEYGFTAMPAGFRYYDGKFFDFGFSGYWWSSKEYSESRAFFRLLYYSDTNFFRFDNTKKIGFSVRCLKSRP